VRPVARAPLTSWPHRPLSPSWLREHKTAQPENETHPKDLSATPNFRGGGHLCREVHVPPAASLPGRVVRRPYKTVGAQIHNEYRIVA